LNLFADFRKNIFFKKEGNFILNLVIVLYLTAAIFLTFLIMDILLYNVFELNFNILLILFCLILPLIFTGLNYKSQQLSSSSKFFFNNIFDYYIPIILSVLSLILFLIGEGFSLTNLNFTDFIDKQIIPSIKLYDVILPAFFIIINPFSAIAFLTGLIGIFREYRSDAYSNNKINQKFFSKILQNISIFAFIIIFVFLFLGGGYFFGQNLLANISMSISLSFLIVLIIAFIDYDRPISFIERKVGKLFSVPMVFSIISLFYTAFLLYFNTITYI
jgi:hypothetical protein